MREKIFVSACLLGVNCKYNGFNNENEKVLSYIKDKEVIPICPEIMGGLSTPREPSEIFENKVISKSGKDVTSNFQKGAEETLNLARKLGVKKAILKSRSPSCGLDEVYDGTFSNKLVNKNGITAELLKNNGFVILREEDVDHLISRK